MKRYTEKEAEKEISQQVIKAEEELLSKIWEKLLPTLGGISLAAIFRRILRKVGESYPIFSSLRVSEDGFFFKEMEDYFIKNQDKEELSAGFSLFLSELITFLSEMTGNILIGDVKGVIGQSKIKMEVYNEQKG